MRRRRRLVVNKESNDVPCETSMSNGIVESVCFWLSSMVVAKALISSAKFGGCFKMKSTKWYEKFQL